MKDTLLTALKDATADWENDFVFDVAPDYEDDNCYYFDVAVTIRNRDVEQTFKARVVDERDLDSQFCYIECGEDNWTMITQEALFTWLWFDLVDTHHL